MPNAAHARDTCCANCLPRRECIARRFVPRETHMHPLFAQRNDGDMPAGLEGALVVYTCGFVLAMLVLGIMLLLKLQEALSRCRRHYRAMEPALVWLNLIPLFNLYWQFITVKRIADSLQREFRNRGWHDGDDYGRSVGLYSCWFRICGFIPFIGPLFGLAALICLIIYWVKIAGYSRQLATRAHGDADHYRDDWHDEARDDDRRDRDRDDRDDDGGRPRRPWDRGAR